MGKGPVVFFDIGDTFADSVVVNSRLARQRAALPASRCLVVGEHEAERKVALAAGLRDSPHPLHALHLIESLVT